MFTYTNMISIEKYNFTVQAETKKELYKLIANKLGFDSLDPEHKQHINKQLKNK